MPDINKSYQWAINTCNAPNVGYSQAYRNQRTVNGITYYDCSSFIWYALIAGGFDCVKAHGGNTWPLTTYDEAQVLTNLGFEQVPLNGEWKAGDILLRSTHTEMVYSGGTGQGISMGAHTDSYPLTEQVSISTYTTYASSWSSLWRYGEGGATGYGFSAYVIAAICGNWWQESGINPGIYEGLNVVPMEDNSVYGGFGLGQWTNATFSGGGVYRRTALGKYCDANGYSYSDPEGQLNFFMEENYWTPNGYAAQFGSLNEFLTSQSTDLATLTYAFLQGWEGIWDGTEGIRYNSAVDCYNYIMLHANDTSITEWIVGNRYLSNEERLNNAVMLYRWFGLGGGGGTITEEVKKMPIWMMIRYY